MSKPIYPSLYQVNTRVWLTSLSKSVGRPARLDDIPDVELGDAERIEVDIKIGDEIKIPRLGIEKGILEIDAGPV